MPVSILCPRLTCRSVLRVPDSVRGKSVRCPECGATFTVPAAGAGKSPQRPKNTPTPRS
jgi:predicted Zn finger-like uncharacterized protein